MKAVESAGGQTDDAGGNGVQFHQAADGVVLAPA